jgi:hypothetical protein
MIEHLAAIMVMAMVCLSIAAVRHTHEQVVVPARLNALAEQAGLNMVRIHQATAATSSSVVLGHQQFKTRISGNWVEVQCGVPKKTWRFQTGVHVD